jgi:diacylglycerol kinase (ATP)
MMTALVILNPYAGRWKALKFQKEAEEALRNAGISYQLKITENPGHGIEIARAAALEDFNPIIVAGGDGSIGDVLNGLYSSDPSGTLGPIGILPLGTANDMVVNLDLPLDLPTAARVIADGNTRSLDLCKVNEWVFGNNSAVGLEPMVTIYNIRMVHLRGTIRYLVAALRAILDKNVWNMDLEWDSGSYQGPISLVTIGNNPITGGLFKMAPAADPQDGKLTFVHGFAPTRRNMLSLLPRTISGEYVKDPAIHQYHTTKLVIRSQEPTPLQVDGEIREEAATDFVYEILPARLNLLSP